mmetsp:Transcript_1231/g.3580  ORF Transcript_1231/g.3580 Transcript_1231/m.3580 type:complete len:250 (-) Transcript_1231:170-919(-)
MDEQNKAITQSEEKELQRVFTTMCNFQAKSKLVARLTPKRERRDKLLAYRKSPETAVALNAQQEKMSMSDVTHELETLKREIVAIEKEIATYDSDPNRKIRSADLSECLRKLGKACTRKEVEELIWEVDENLDGFVDWDEFKLTYQRNLADATGLEPCQLFNVVQFMLYDKDGSGKVTVDETMHMLYTRYGRDKLEGQMKLLFGEDLATEDGDGELSFSEYLAAICSKNRRQFSQGSSEDARAAVRNKK